MRLTAGTMSQEAVTSIARVRSSRGHLFRPLILAVLVGTSLTLTGCGSAGPAKSYQQGWDRAVASPGYDCDTVPSAIASHSDWTRGCSAAENYLGIHDTTGHYPTPTTHPGDL